MFPTSADSMSDRNRVNPISVGEPLHTSPENALGDRGQRRACVGVDALDHGSKSVRALRGKVLAQAQALECGDRVGGQNLAGVLAGEQREQNGDEPAYDMGVAVAGEGEHGTVMAVRTHGGRKPDLARAALHLVRVDAVAGGKRAQAAAELDDITVAVVPLLEQRKVV